MKTRIAYCGLLCHKCPIFIVTKTGTLREKRRLARIFSIPGRHLTVKEIECYGCKEVGKKILKGCDTCKKRVCAIKKKLDNCGQCTSYPCQELDYLLTRLWQSGARERLDRVHKSI
jgi:hypothetical protein